MVKAQEVERIAKKLDKMVHKKNTVSGARSPGWLGAEHTALSIRKQVGISKHWLTFVFRTFLEINAFLPPVDGHC